MAICPTCGKTFKPCTTRLDTVFNWRAVACCRECADAYLEAIRKSRSKPAEPPKD